MSGRYICLRWVTRDGRATDVSNGVDSCGTVFSSPYYAKDATCPTCGTHGGRNGAIHPYHDGHKNKVKRVLG